MRNLRRTGVGLVAAAICITSVIGSAAPLWATSGQACATSKYSGKMCNKILGRGLTVTDVVALFTLPRADYLTRRDVGLRANDVSLRPAGRPSGSVLRMRRTVVVPDPGTRPNRRARPP